MIFTSCMVMSGQEGCSVAEGVGSKWEAEWVGLCLGHLAVVGVLITLNTLWFFVNFNFNKR